MLPDAVTLTPVIESDFAVLRELGRRALWLQVNKKNAAASRFYRSAKSTGRPMKGRPITAEEFERMVAVVPSVVGDDQALPWRHYPRGLWASGLRLGESLDLFRQMGPLGLEPRTNGLKVRCSNQLSYGPAAILPTGTR